MGKLHLIRRNLGRKKVRTLFTGLTIVIAFLLFGLLGALNYAFSGGVDLVGADRLITLHRISLIQPLPLSYKNRIASLEGVEAVTNMTWAGGYFQEARNQIATSPTEPDEIFQVYNDWDIPADQFAAWQADRTSMVVGAGLADTMGWKLGDRIPISSSIYSNQDGTRQWPMTIAGIFTTPDRNSELQILMHYDYFNESVTFGRDTAGWYVVRVADPAQADQVAAAIDALFANSAAETRTSTEQGFMQNYADQIGDIGAIVGGVLIAVFFTMLLVAGNTMIQAVRERTGELAVMKTLGFSNGQIMGMVIGESVLLTTVAGALGMFLAVLATSGMKASLQQFLPALAVTPERFATGICLAAFLGVLTAVLPALRTMRLDVVSALGRR